MLPIVLFATQYGFHAILSLELSILVNLIKVLEATITISFVIDSLR